MCDLSLSIYVHVVTLIIVKPTPPSPSPLPLPSLSLSLFLSGKELGETVLFFGCRHKNEDYIYKDELERYHSDSVLSHLHVAFSRDKEEKDYVQHHLQKNGNQIWNLLEKQGYFYICG